MEINRVRLLAQLKNVEGFSPKAFWDVKQYTYGYGCLVPNANATITEPKAAEYLERRVKQLGTPYLSVVIRYDVPGSGRDRG